MILKIRWNYPCLKEQAETPVWEYIQVDRITIRYSPNVNADIDIDYIINGENKEVSLLASSEAYLLENGKTIDKIK